ncbi:MAG TPA: hypothetical protein VEL47_00970, partial [Myxococcota bacterium]|nr:hypothetical protein [Myxococcota bacterium]
GKVPGIEAIFCGFLVLLIGLYMCFFMTPIRYLARISQGDGTITVTLAAQGYRNPQLVKDLFNQKLARLTQNEHGTKHV